MRIQIYIVILTSHGEVRDRFTNMSGCAGCIKEDFAKELGPKGLLFISKYLYPTCAWQGHRRDIQNCQDKSKG